MLYQFSAPGREARPESIAFPLISAGIYGYPRKEALQIAVAAIKDFLEDRDMEVYLVVFDKAAVELSEELLGAVQAYIDEHYVDEYSVLARESLQRNNIAEASVPSCLPQGLAPLIGNLDEPFSRTLLRLIDAKGKTDVEVYKGANIDRKLFSKIRSNMHYMPSKRLQLPGHCPGAQPEETEDLLARAAMPSLPARNSTSSFPALFPAAYTISLQSIRPSFITTSPCWALSLSPGKRPPRPNAMLSSIH